MTTSFGTLTSFLLVFLTACGDGESKPAPVIAPVRPDTVVPVIPPDPVDPLSNEALWTELQQDTGAVEIPFGSAVLRLHGMADSSLFWLQTLELRYADGGRERFPMDGKVLPWQKAEGNAYIRVEDLNFDGAPDLMLFNNAGAVNSWYECWLWDQASGRLQYHEQLSGLTCLKVDRSGRQLLSYFRMGACAEHLNFFRPEGDRLLLLRHLFNEEPVGDATGCRTYEEGPGTTAKRLVDLGDSALLDVYERYGETD